MSCQPRGNSDQRKQESRMSARIIHVELTEELALSGSINCMTHSPAQKVRAGSRGRPGCCLHGPGCFPARGSFCQDIILASCSQERDKCGPGPLAVQQLHVEPCARTLVIRCWRRFPVLTELVPSGTPLLPDKRQIIADLALYKLAAE